ncbi:enoyl-CoA hydratase/isomerase family protein [Metasolibacillus meyeri]|uniref:enoyl-CoA hydratase/isomerase family protein n=1 Tax=Metasolibacillus meyeri TaxID=1071052 RepID=UPI000D31EB2B|nr:enoyl-CoA hydratase/isomerase family protein [Metasolibacillus meyeri]
MQIQTVRLHDEDAKIIYQETAGLAIITIHRPQAKNALTAKMWRELASLASQSLQNPKNKVLILRGAGENFSAGSDIKEFHAMSLEQAEQAFIEMERTISTVENLPLPVIGVINGPAMGAGLELALACDIRIGSDKAKMGIPVGKLGITLNNRFAKRLVDLVGPSATKDFVFTGRMYKAEEAFHAGMLNYLVAEKDLTKFMIRMGKLVAGMSPDSLLAVKKSVQQCTESTPALWQGATPFVSQNDFAEGVRAFVEKRQPQFKRPQS